MRIDREPVIDGRLDEDFWRELPVQESFAPLAAGASFQATGFRVARTDEALIIGITCREEDTGALKAGVTRRDGRLWQDDIIELFLGPGNGYYYQVAVNSAGAIYDARRPARTGLTRREMEEGLFWAGAWDIGVHLGEGEWSVEIRVPFASLDPAGGFEDTWRMNVGRTEHRHGYSCWAPPPEGRGFHDLDSYGYLEGMEIDAGRYVLDAAEIEFPDLLPGVNRVSLSLPARAGPGSFIVRQSTREWRPGPLPERKAAGEAVPVRHGRLEVNLDVPVGKSLVMKELVVEFADARTGFPVLIVTHLFQAPLPLEVSTGWTVHFLDRRTVPVAGDIRTAPGSAAGTLLAEVFFSGETSPVYRARRRIRRPGRVSTPVPVRKLRRDGLYEAVLTMDFEGLPRAVGRVEFFMHSVPLY